MPPLRIVRVHDLSVPGNLSRVSWKLSRTVLRGGANSNVGPLLGQRDGKTKQPYCFEVNDGELFAFAGLWDEWRNAQGELVESCTILTTMSNSLLAGIHDRMPVILRPDDYELWLDPAFRDTSSRSEMLRPFNAGLMSRHPVSAKINQVQNDDAECAKPLELGESPAQAQLF
jgi:putative SOS response-associated peptidase YedK